MKDNLNKLFSSLLENHVKENNSLFSDIPFEMTSDISCYQRLYEQADIDFITSYFTRGFNVSILTGPARDLIELSFYAFDLLLHAWLSELPVEREITAFGKNILSAVNINNLKQRNQTIEKIINDRINKDTLAVLNASQKVNHEVHRMMGLLRFSPNKEGVFIAKCEPDHFILPALKEFFSLRFGKTAWSIIDEKRQLCLASNGQVKIMNNNFTKTASAKSDDWEELWKHYHKTINNEDRNNPDLQRQFMPKRYWKYLPEV
ncbi:MAG: TIGR03915 family putative DNA repair protein [Treponema sp.]|nr:TIGR03915 family putative DNA repair protein [Treponema sp.]